MVSVWRKQSIAVVELYGTIGGAVRPAIYLPILERVRNSRRFRGLVIAIDSPGGSAAASEELYRGISKIASTKPVVAYIRERGASGAYYISCAAQKIVAVPNALVGSIGVIFARPTAEQLFQKVGLDFSIQKSGKYKDMYGPWRKP
ncbi:MAG: S49 family peptidase, partial [Chloroflexi bacterium]|nr:S49 family peptidase [Chloroflexota bacterium]